MTKEEKKAIEIVKGISEDDLLNYWEGPEEPYNAIQVLLNLIEKQEKEIERMKSLDIYKLVEDIETGQFVSKDKIREKIKEYKGLKEIDKMAYEEQIKPLQELLEEE